MRFRVIAEPEAAFDAWLAAQRQTAAQPPPDVLATIQAKGCGGCHTIGGVQGMGGTIGPDLTHFASRRTFAGSIFPNNPGRVAIWLKDPGAVKPGVDMPNLHLITADQALSLAWQERPAGNPSSAQATLALWGTGQELVWVVTYEGTCVLYMDR